MTRMLEAWVARACLAAWVPGDHMLELDGRGAHPDLIKKLPHTYETYA